MQRTVFAERLAAGLAGWFQRLAAQDLHQDVGEDAVQVELVRMNSAQRGFVREPSRRPLNGPDSDPRCIDVAVLGRRDRAEGFYGAIELKWPGTRNDVAALRRYFIQDAVRRRIFHDSEYERAFLAAASSPCNVCLTGHIGVPRCRRIKELYSAPCKRQCTTPT